jgi:H+/Cl- antiporter ClcA
MRALVAAPHASACARRVVDAPTPHARAASCAVASTSGSALPIPGQDVSGGVGFSARAGWRARRAATPRAAARVRSLRRSPHLARAARGDRSAPAPGSAPSPGTAGPSAGEDYRADLDDSNDANDRQRDLELEPDDPKPTDLLAVACGVGLLTGLGVGAFNIAEHGVHDLVFLTTTVYSPDRFRVEGMRDVRPETWVQAVGAVAAPTAAGFAVTGLRFLAGGFDGEEAPRWGSENTTKHESESAEQTEASSDAAAPKSWTVAARAAARPALKAAAAVVTLGAGASLGPEGPSVEIGASIAGSLHEATTSSSGGSGGFFGSQTLAERERDGAGANESRRARRRRARLASRRLGLVAAGSAAGISAGFGAPIAGLFFAFESVLQPASARRAGNAAGDVDVDDLGGSTGFGALTTESVILASVLAAVVSGALLGEQPAFIVPAFELKNLAELPLYLPLGLLCGATAVAFRSSSVVIGRGFAALERGGASGAGGEERGETANSSARFALRVPREWHAPLGGAAFGVVATLFPEVTYQGFDNVNSMLGAEGSPFRTPYSPSLLTGLVLVKLAATALCRQSGLVGGVYAPSLFMGAALGSAYGAALVPLALAGAPVAPPQAYALVGMAGVLAGICRVPLTAILLLFELTHDYRIIVPLMGTVGVASWVAGAAERGEGANVRERQANGQPPEQPSYVAVEVPKGKAEGVVGGAGVLSFDDDDDGGGGRAGGRRALDAARSASRAARVSDAVRTDAPRVLASASAMDAALAAREAVRDGSAARCALVVDPDGSLRGVATARSMAAVIASGRGDAATAFEACDGDVPLVASSWTLREAEARMRARRVTLAAVVATVLDANESGEEKRAALGVLEAGAAAAERDAAALGAALRAHEAAAANGRKGAKGRGANVPR